MHVVMRVILCYAMHYVQINAMLNLVTTTEE